MKPEKSARTAIAVTLSKGKMYEYNVPEEDHIAIPDGLDLSLQFPLAVGTIGDFAAERTRKFLNVENNTVTPHNEIIFSAQVLQAFDDARLKDSLSFNLRLLAAAGFYLGNLPGNAAVLIAKLSLKDLPGEDPLATATRIAMDKPWNYDFNVENTFPQAAEILSALSDHFRSGSSPDHAIGAIQRLRTSAYSNGSAHELLMADALCAVCATRIDNSAWSLLPKYSGLGKSAWRDYLSRPASIKEMWPSQRILGEAGLYTGKSGVVQMPTSAGKSRATELIIRSSFLSLRTNLALVVAPFRALCQEIANDLGKAFLDDGYGVNQLSDALQTDPEFDILSSSLDSGSQVVVLTPEKLLYVLRQQPDFVQNAGLIVYDEGHQFDTGSRGVTYELLLTSIKRLLNDSAQIVLISAVIRNASAIAEWLLQDGTKVVSDKSLQARRLIAFASLPKGKDGQLQFNVASGTEQTFFVPRVIVPERQPRLPKERIDRFFPTPDSSSMALYLGLRLVSNGGVAIYAGKKVSAAKIVKDAVEDTFRRGISLPPPSIFSDPKEIERFIHLYTQNFGSDSYLTKAAQLGIFAHHGNTPQGIRIAIEHAMRQRQIRLIVCTSTLAQGVNLPIRYLLVTSAMQGAELIKTRDFHNLMGRAGRAGMYGEGTVIFTDHRLYDERRVEPRRWKGTIDLISPDNADPTGSTLLSLFEPMKNATGSRGLSNPLPSEIALGIVNNWQSLYDSMRDIATALKQWNFTAESLRDQLKGKKRIIEAIESFLMTYRSDGETQDFVDNAKKLAGETLAFSIASDDQKTLLVNIFEAIAWRIEILVPQVETQNRFGRTLLGIDQSLAVEAWVAQNEHLIGEANSGDSLFELAWPLLCSLSDEKRLTDTAPQTALFDLAQCWLRGQPFIALLELLNELDASYPFGKFRRKFDLDLVVDICEQTFGFEFSLTLACIKESFIPRVSKKLGRRIAGEIDVLQKRLKYGLPNQDCVSYYEVGFSDRVIAQVLADRIFWDAADTSTKARQLIRDDPEIFAGALGAFPSYFTEIYQSIVSES